MTSQRSTGQVEVVDTFEHDQQFRKDFVLDYC